MRQASTILLVLLALPVLVAASCEGEDPGAGRVRPPAERIAARGNPLLEPDSKEMNLTAPATFRASLTTSQGTVVIEVYRDWAPLAADRFYSLVKNGFFDNCRIFRVVPNFIAQWGIHGRPKIAQIWANASIRDEPAVETNAKGTVAFAKANMPNTRATQIFINLKDNGPALDPQGFAPFGKVVEGMDVVGKFYEGYGDRHAPNQDRLIREGNAYLSTEYPMLDYISKAVVLED